MWQRDQPEVNPRIVSSLLRTDLHQAETDLPASVFSNLSCRSLSAMHSHGPDADLFLRQEYVDETVHRDGVWQRL